MKNIWVSDLSASSPVSDVFLVQECTVGTARDDSMFLRMKLQDRTGVIEAVKWAASPYDQQLARVASYVQVRGRVDTYQGNLQIKVDRLSVPEQEVDPADFLLVSPRDRDEMVGEMRACVESIENPQVRTLLEEATGDTELGRKFAMAPAAVRYHHAYLGGLLEHTLSVVQIAEFMAQHYPELNRDLLLAGVILHDIGKTEELSFHSTFRYKDSGQLLGHITQGAILVNRLMDAIPDFDPLWRTLITHIILSHHGKHEFGSPVLPAFREAVVVHYIEDLDSKMQLMGREMESALSQGIEENWTKKIPAIDRALFKGVPTKQPPEPPPTGPPDDEYQPPICWLPDASTSDL
ncbi:MAG: HD domain-containing protein [Armatimonadetes bacterium]|nr:HD domain-containing protein [Armatimonadota bacterium]